MILNKETLHLSPDIWEIILFQIYSRNKSFTLGLKLIKLDLEEFFSFKVKGYIESIFKDAKLEIVGTARDT